MSKDVEFLDVDLDDIEMIRNWRNSPKVSDYMYTNNNITVEDQKKWFNKIENETSSKYWLIVYDGKKIGLVWITGIDKVLNSCYWAFYLGEDGVRGAGIGSKVEYKVLEYVFDHLNLNKLRCEVFVTNDKVIKMHEKFGFRREAYFREHCEKLGEKKDVVGLALLQSEWLILKPYLNNKIYGN